MIKASTSENNRPRCWLLYFGWMKSQMWIMGQRTNEILTFFFFVCNAPQSCYTTHNDTTPIHITFRIQFVNNSVENFLSDFSVKYLINFSCNLIDWVKQISLKHLLPFRFVCECVCLFFWEIWEHSVVSRGWRGW